MSQFFVAFKKYMMYNSYDVMIHMKKGEQMTEEEIKQKEEELKTKEEELKTKEEGLNSKEAELTAKEEDVNKIAENMKKGYEDQITKLKDDYEARIKTRDDVIGQLSANKEQTQPHMSFIEELNAKREAQNKKW